LWCCCTPKPQSILPHNSSFSSTYTILKHVTSIATTWFVFYSGHSYRRQHFRPRAHKVPTASYPLQGLPCSTATTSTWWQCARDQVCERVPLWLNGLQFALIAKTVYRLEGSDFTLVYDTLETGTRLPIFSNRHTNATVIVHFP
jgi:hypothetical protein